MCRVLIIILTCVAVVCSAERLRAAESRAVVDGTPTAQGVSGELGGLQAIDWALIVVYALSTIGLGWFYSRRQRTTDEYFVGNRNMNPLLIGVSLFATLLSTISYLAMPGESLGKGPVGMANILAYPFVFMVVGFGLIPVFMRHRVTSAYELLETKLGLGVRLLGASMFLVLRLVWMSLLVYLAAEAMVVMLGLDAKWVPLIVLTTGLVAVIYTSLGGLQAVVITDCIQTLLLFGGALLVLIVVTIDFNGFEWFPTTWQKDQWDTQPIFPSNPQTRVSLIGTVIMVFTWSVCTAAGDQTSVQRFMATRDAKAARWAMAMQLSVAAVVSITLGLVGFALLAYFQKHADYLPAGMNLKDNADLIFPRYIAYHLPVGVSGLVVAAMFAAAMSSIDSGVNSITAVVTTDFLGRFGRQPRTERGRVRFSQALALGIGGIIVVGSSFVGNVPGNITAVTQKTTSLLATPIFALFFFALFVKFAKPLGVWAGAICGICTAAMTAFSGPLVQWLVVNHGFDPATFGTQWKYQLPGPEDNFIIDPISFQWIGPIALAVNLLVGSLVSLMIRGQKGEDGFDS